MDLKSLLVDVKGLKDDEIDALGRKLYKTIYITSGFYGIKKTHDGEDVRFWEDRFEHAFYTSSNRAKNRDDKDKLAVERIERIKWIEKVIGGDVPGSACYKAQSTSGRKTEPNRLYVISRELYVVWLEPRNDGGWKFSSAYTARPENFRRYCQSGRRIWKWKTP